MSDSSTSQEKVGVVNGSKSEDIESPHDAPVPVAQSTPTTSPAARHRSRSSRHSKSSGRKHSTRHTKETDASNKTDVEVEMEETPKPSKERSRSKAKRDALVDSGRAVSEDLEPQEVVITTNALRRSTSEMTGNCTPLKGYEDYLAAVLQEGDGHISKEQYAMLEQLRAKYNVTAEDHLNILKCHGWTEEQFESAKYQLPVEYVTYLRAVLVDGIVDANEAKALDDLRRKHSLDDKDHLNALKTLGYSERDFLMACAKGTTSRTESRFGRSSTKIKTADVDKSEYCRGLIVAPYLHQWWGIDEKFGKRVLFREPGADNRTATTQELFYDLVFVAVIAKLVHLFAADHSKWLEFIVLFSCVWRIWVTSTFYNSIWDTKDLTVKLAMWLQMFGLVCMGISIDDAFELGGTRGFAAGFVVAVVPLAFMYLWVIIMRTRGWQFAVLTLCVNASCPLLFIISIAVAGDLHGHGYLYWWIAALVAPDVLNTLTIFWPQLTRFRQPLNVEHVTERFGLFIIIVLGESITSLLADLPYRGDLLNWEVYLSAGAGLAIAFSLKWIYFDVDEEKRKHPFRRGRVHAIPWSTSHWPLAMSIAASAAGIFGLLHTIVFYIESEVFHHNVTALEGGAVSHKRFMLNIEDFSGLASNTTGNVTEPTSHSAITVEKSHEILMCVGLSLSLIFFGFQSAVSKHPKEKLVPARIRLIVRIAVALVIAVLPAGDYAYGGLVLLIVVALLISSLALFEMISILPKHVHDPNEIEELAHADVDAVRAFVSRSYSRSLIILNKNDEEHKARFPLSLCFEILRRKWAWKTTKKITPQRASAS